MVAIAKFVRGAFGFQALLLGVLLVVQPYFLWRGVQNFEDPERTTRVWVGEGIIMAALFLFTMVFGMAWWTLRKGKPFARAWALTASAFSLPLLGLGTIMGLAGLVAFSRRDTVEGIAIRNSDRHTALPGDGTSKWIEAIASGGTVIAAVAAFIFWGRWGARHELPSDGFVPFLIQVQIASLAATAIHECGHLLAGWVSGMKLRLFSVGPFEWKLRAGKWGFRFHAAGLLATRGATGLVPENLQNLRARRVFVSAAGPAASLLLGVIALGATLTAKNQPWESMWGLCSVTATFSLLAFVGNLLPVRPEDQYSDGAHIYQILSNGPWADYHWATSVVSSSLVTPRRPRDYDIGAIERSGRFLTQGQDAMLLRLYAYQHYLDSGKIPEALRALADAEAVYEGIASTVPADLHSEFVFASALLKRDPDAARRWWQRMHHKEPSRFDADYWRARSALRWIEKELDEAREAWDKGNALAQKLPAAGAYEFDRWCFAELRNAMDATTPSFVA